MRYLLVDSNHLSARCLHALPNLATRDGRESGTIFGFLKGLAYIKNTLKITEQQIILCWDGGRSKVRMDLYPEYKGGRTSSKAKAELTPEEKASRESYYNQLNALYDMIPNLGIKQVKIRGAEADDLLGILSRFYEDKYEVIVYSGDHDLHQLVSKNVSICDPSKGELSYEDILSWWKIDDPKTIILYKAIVGDSSDNIHGVPGIGDSRVKQILPYVDIVDGKLVTTSTDIKEKDKKWFTKAFNYRDIIERNYKLITLPRTWAESFYSDAQTEEGITQLLVPVVKNSPEFYRKAAIWEVQSTLNLF